MSAVARGYALVAFTRVCTSDGVYAMVGQILVVIMVLVAQPVHVSSCHAQRGLLVFQLLPVTEAFATVSVLGRVVPCLMARIAASGTSWCAADISTTH